MKKIKEIEISGSRNEVLITFDGDEEKRYLPKDLFLALEKHLEERCAKDFAILKDKLKRVRSQNWGLKTRNEGLETLVMRIQGKEGSLSEALQEKEHEYPELVKYISPEGKITELDTNAKFFDEISVLVKNYQSGGLDLLACNKKYEPNRLYLGHYNDGLR
jgi:hypothetical protein